ncbi:hypothetical protein CDAR_81781 [Caerostris darwini]|uniref:Uncharacterized protein n=1 Tax=Caerostris darwini TaxID=1538125 RepID=A0AAV4SSA5_9ARAC|nr:hypothetical protein CDAR_81781 [Caerostris darwini]
MPPSRTDNPSCIPLFFTNYTRMGFIFAAAQIMTAAKVLSHQQKFVPSSGNLFMNLRRQGKLENTETHTKGYLATILTMRWNNSSSKFCMILATQSKCV